jgi:hypothetical protein
MLMTVLQVTGFIVGLSSLLMVLAHLEPAASPRPAAAPPPVAAHLCSRGSRTHRRTGRPTCGARRTGCPYRDQLSRARTRPVLAASHDKS